jgi:sugar phosphate isomerase/epimerase
VSLAHLTVLDADPLALIEAAAGAGFDAIGLRIVPPFAADPIVPVVGDAGLQKRIKRRLRDTGIAILDVEAIWLRPDTRIEDIRPALETGAALGAKYVLSVGFDTDTARLLDNFATLCGMAHGCGLRTMFEFIPYSTTGSLREAHDLLVAAAPANAGLLVDALHLRRSGGHPADVAAYDPALFSYVHLCDAPMAQPAVDGSRDEARRNRLYPGDGELWLDAFLDAFPPHTPVAVEAPNAACARLSVAERAKLAGAATRRLLRRRGGGLTQPEQVS